MIFCLLGFILGCNDAENTQKDQSKNTATVTATSKDNSSKKPPSESTKSAPKKVVDVVESQPKEKIEAPSPVQEPLNGGPYPGLLVSQAWFWKDGNGVVL